MVFAVLSFASCSSDDEEYVPVRASSGLGNDVYLTIKHANGYNYDDLIAKRNIRIYGKASKMDLQLSVDNKK